MKLFLALCVVAVLSGCAYGEIQMVHCEYDYSADYGYSVFRASCPICGMVNQRNGKYIDLNKTVCPHYLSKESYFFFDSTEVEKLQKRINELQVQIDDMHKRGIK